MATITMIDYHDEYDLDQYNNDINHDDYDDDDDVKPKPIKTTTNDTDHDEVKTVKKSEKLSRLHDIHPSCLCSFPYPTTSNKERSYQGGTSHICYNFEPFQNRCQLPSIAYTREGIQQKEDIR